MVGGKRAYRIIRNFANILMMVQAQLFQAIARLAHAIHTLWMKFQ
jgi:hypothetical protein